MNSVPQQGDGEPDARYDEAIAQMTDPERYKELRAVSFEDRHECPITDCNLSAEEHHRLMFGIMSENRALKQSNPLADPMNPAYQRGFVAGADAIIELAIECIGDQTTANLREVARERGFIA